ncbi:MAG: bifunctional phosphoglucose/phosphomannose isomerase [Candidatus Wildermuthbacteria bacterium]|nr:bifunctional phosphoglucose/phosphomannose isomerase [Candidatus Wildermuthbacteria bacterium]
MIEKAIKNFPKQFEWEPKIGNKKNWKQFSSFILAGMGGSHLVGDIFQAVAPGFNLSVHQDYGLPAWPLVVLKDTLVIASSYSGNTEETLSAFEEAVSRQIPVAAISIGGKLLEMAKKQGVPYIQIPDTGIQPRMATGYMFKALSKITGREDLLSQAGEFARLRPEEFQERGKELAQKLKGKIPVAYASNRNYCIAYIWKITFNETAKIPSFYNVFPELNHNEMTGFDVKPATKGLSNKFHFVFLRDSEDEQRIQKRMEVLKRLYEERGLGVEIIDLQGSSRMERIFSSLLLADWAAYHTAKLYGVEPEQVPMVEDFKKLIS